jgi:hypothetical protein
MKQTVTRSILPQNAFHFAAKRGLLCGKMHPVLPQNAPLFCYKTPLHFAAKWSLTDFVSTGFFLFMPLST